MLSAAMPFRRTFIRLHAALIAALLVVLVLAQTLGALHRIAHPQGTGAQTVSAATTATSGGSWLQDLFAGHDHDGGCDLFDQLTHGDALCVTVDLVVPSQAPSAPAAVHATWHLAAQAAGFLARGPPALS